MLIKKACIHCKIKRRKQPKKGDQKTMPWFDGACESAKNEVKKLGNDLKKDPENQELRNAIGREKKSLKNLVTRKKRKYKKNIVNKMTQTHKSLNAYWKHLAKLSKKQSKN